MDVDLVVVPGERLTGAALAPVLADLGERWFAVAATAGSTNLGLIDELDIGRRRLRRGAASGSTSTPPTAAPPWPRRRPAPRFAGIERADSFIVDPHKWLFAPFDSCALLYRRPELARRCHAQHASYLDILNESGDWNPSDFAVHLSRRARGLPFWLSLAAHGTRAYADAVEGCLAVARAGAALVDEADASRACVGDPSCRSSPSGGDRLGPRPTTRSGRAGCWPRARRSWCRPAMHGEPILRLCIVNPRTTVDDVALVVDSLR